MTAPSSPAPSPGPTAPTATARSCCTVSPATATRCGASPSPPPGRLRGRAAAAARSRHQREDMLTTHWATGPRRSRRSTSRWPALRQGGRGGPVHGRLADLLAGDPPPRDRRDRVHQPRHPGVAGDARARRADGGGRRGRSCPASAPDIADPTPPRSAYEGNAHRRCSACSTPPRSSAATSTASPALLLFTSPQDHVVPPADSDHLAAHVTGPGRAGDLRGAATTSRPRLRQGLIGEGCRRLRRPGDRF